MSNIDIQVLEFPKHIQKLLYVSKPTEHCNKFKRQKKYVKINLYVTEKHTYEVWNSNQLHIAAKY